MAGYKAVCHANNAEYSKNNVRSASRVVCEELAAAGVALLEDFVSEGEAAALLAYCDGPGAWDCSLSRRVQHYGYRFAYATKSCEAVEAPLPSAFRAVSARVAAGGASAAPWADDSGVQCTVNEYLPGQGIAPHVDTHAAFADGLFSLTLGAGVALRLQKNRRTAKDAPVHTLWLPPRSLLCLTGDARYVYTHGIVSRKGDLVDGDWRPRGRRVSLTFRHLPAAGPCPCGRPEACDAREGGAPKLLPTRLRPPPESHEARAARGTAGDET